MKKIGAICLFLCGCSANPIVPLTSQESTIVLFPEIGVIRSSEVGERVASIKSQVEQLSLEVRSATTFGRKEDASDNWICGLTIMPSTAIQRGTYDKTKKNRNVFKKNRRVFANCFGPLLANQTQSDGTVGGLCQGRTKIIDVCQNIEDMSFFMIHMNSQTGKAEVPLLQDFDHLETHKTILEGSSVILAELIYDGRRGDVLNFTHNEYMSDSKLPVSSQTFEYRVASSSFIEFKEFRLEMIDASDTTIKYRILSAPKQE